MARGRRLLAWGISPSGAPFEPLIVLDGDIGGVAQQLVEALVLAVVLRFTTGDPCVRLPAIYKQLLMLQRSSLF